MNKLFYIIPLVLIGLIGLATAIDCGGYSYATLNGSSDYFGVNTATTNSTIMTADQTFGAYTFFTPRVNFTRTVNETITGLTTGSTNTLAWLTPLDISASLELYNNSVLIDPSNYTLIQNAPNVKLIQWNVDEYNESTILVQFNRTFIKNAEDLITNVTAFQSGINTNYFLTQAGGAAYGDAKTFKLNGVLLGGFVDDSNWAVGWTYTERTCTNPGVDTGVVAGINNLKGLAYAGFALLAVGILVMVAFGLLQLFKGGNVDFMTITIAAISIGVVIVIAYVIIYFVAKALGA